MSPRDVEKRHEELVERLERFLEREARDPETRIMLASLEGD